MKYVNPFTGKHKAGNHAFRRFRNTYLRNYTECPEGLYKYWMGHAGRNMSDLYDKVKEDVGFRTRKRAERVRVRVVLSCPLGPAARESA